jgi:hypothetical protein
MSCLPADSGKTAKEGTQRLLVSLLYHSLTMHILRNPQIRRRAPDLQVRLPRAKREAGGFTVRCRVRRLKGGYH